MRFKTFLSIGIIFLFSSMFASAALDLRFTTAITQHPDPANPGDEVMFYVNFKAVGADVTNMKIIGGIDGTQLLEATFPKILAGKSEQGFIQGTATAGSHTAWFELDPDHTCGDSNYGNNRVKKHFSVTEGGPSGTPDLRLYVKSDPENLAVSDGDIVTFELTAMNLGTGDSSACEMEFKKGTSVLQTWAIPGMTHNWEEKRTYKWTTECGAVLNAKIDSKNTNAETNENNNTWSKMVVCGKYSDLIPVINYSPIFFKSGDSVKFTIKVMNIGEATANPSKLHIMSGGSYVADINVFPLKSGASTEITYFWNAICNGVISIIADAMNDNKETNENNNLLLKSMVCGQKRVNFTEGKPNKKLF